MKIRPMTMPEQVACTANPTRAGGPCWAVLGHVGQNPRPGRKTNTTPNPTQPMTRVLGRVWPGNSTRPTRTLRAMLVGPCCPVRLFNNEIRNTKG